MAKINTLNYQTVASWNGSQDLFIVEQPDGTKVATPAQLKQFVLNDMDEVPTQDSDNPVKSGGIFSTMAVPKYDSANRREYFEGGAAFDGNIDSVPTAGSNNAVASGGTKTYVDALADLSVMNNAIQALDLNNITGRQSIIYTNANSTNKPSGATWGLVITFNFDANSAWQIYLSVTDSKAYSRSKSGGTWHSWLTLSN